MINEQRYRDRKDGIKSFHVQPSKLKLVWDKFHFRRLKILHYVDMDSDLDNVMFDHLK